MPPTTSPNKVKHPQIIKAVEPSISNFVLISNLTLVNNDLDIIKAVNDNVPPKIGFVFANGGFGLRVLMIIM